MILLDSDILIDMLRQDPATHDAVRDLADEDELATSSICIAEVLRGKAQPARRFGIARRKLQGLTEIPFGPDAARRFARMMHDLDRRGEPMPVVDGMIAACALEAGARLATRNVRHYERVPGLQLTKVR